MNWNRLLFLDTFHEPRTSVRWFLANGLLLLAWVWLYASPLRWLGVSSTRAYYRLSVLLFLGILVLAVARGWLRSSFQEVAWRQPPQWAWGPGICVFGATGVFLWSEANIVVNSLAVACLGLGSYGLLGLYMKPQRWRQGWVVVLLLIAVLPFGKHINMVVGFPARVLTAKLIQPWVAWIDPSIQSAQSILLLENGVSHIDLPCSGVKSLWSGLLFFLTVTWLERHRMGWRWWLAGAFFVLSLFFVNAVRVAILVCIGIALKQNALAESLHVPLGVFGFGLACTSAYFALQWAGRRAFGGWRKAVAPEGSYEPVSPGLQHEANGGLGELEQVEEVRRYVDVVVLPDNRSLKSHQEEKLFPTQSTPLRQGVVLWSTLCVFVVGMGLLYEKRNIPKRAMGWRIPAKLVSTWKTQSLTRPEIHLAKRYGGVTSKWGFTFRGVRGAVLFAYSPSWRAHHPAELCLAGQGNFIDAMQTHAWRAPQKGTLRWMRLRRGHRVQSAAYWYQAPSQVTDNLLLRMRDGIFGKQTHWVLVTVVLEREFSFRSVQIQQLLQHLRKQVMLGFQRKSK